MGVGDSSIGRTGVFGASDPGSSPGPRAVSKCPYRDCGSLDVINCGDIGGGEDHYECHECRRGFSIVR